MTIRVGLGHDTHRLVPEGPLILGGIEIDFDSHLAGHSDADVLLHAITDALLGAANLGDIGVLFPDTDPNNAGKDSSVMLQSAHAKITEAGWTIENLDCVVLAEKPKLSPYKSQISGRISKILGITADRVGLKGKTGENTGEIGQGKIIQAICVCLLTR